MTATICIPVSLHLLREQKEILMSMKTEWSNSSDKKKVADADNIEGLLNMIDAMQDYAVDKLGFSEQDVFGKTLEP